MGSRCVSIISSNTVDALTDRLSNTDFGTFVFTPDDTVTIREEDYQSVRDNVILELGMFIGRLGKERCFIISPRTIPFHIPTDLLGMVPATYDPEREDGSLLAALGPVCNKIRQAIESIQHRQQSVKSESQEAPEQRQVFSELMRAFDSITLKSQENAIKEQLKKTEFNN